MRNSLNVKFISALEKCRAGDSYGDIAQLEHISLLKNEHASVQLLIYETNLSVATRLIAKVAVKSDISDCVTVRNVQDVYVPMPVALGAGDDNYISVEPGLFPDLLTPLRYGNSAIIPPGRLTCLWIDITPLGRYAGKHNLTVELYSENGEELYATSSLDVEIIDALLPEAKRFYTQWFYADCLADYYNVPVWSKRHWEIIENYIAAAVRGGVNTILTPLFTLPLDTKPGGERPTAQLVDVTLEGGKYTFGFSRLEKWIDMLLRHNIKLIELSHLFTQWGAAHAPKIVAKVGGRTQRIFGWDTDSSGEEYVAFLRAFLPELFAFLERKGVKDMCCFHISDEPHLNQLETYNKAKAGIADLLEGAKVIDALSDFEFYKTGAVSVPVVACDALEPFIEAGVRPLWTYYCCVQSKKVPNRFIAMPSPRNRIMGVLEYKYDIEGFLQWGFNYYYNRFSDSLLNPFADTSGDYFVPGGDAFSVYPKADGTALDSIHFLVFKHSREDIRAFELLESLTSREYVLNLISENAGSALTFKDYPRDAAYLLSLREKINYKIKELSGGNTAGKK